MNKSKRLLYFTVSLFSGVALGDLFLISFFVTYCLFLATLITYLLYREYMYVRMISVILFGFAIGLLRIDVENIVTSKDAFIGNMLEHVSMITGSIAREPDIRTTHQKLTLDRIHIKEEDVHGKILVLTSNNKAYAYRDTLTFACLLERPEPFETFRYDKYLERFSIYAICAFPKDIERVKTDSLGGRLLALKHTFIKNIENTLPKPHASLAAGILLGERSGFTNEQSEAFKRVGLTHILALSGFNISIVIIALLCIGRGIGMRRRLMFFLITFGIFIFVFITGASPSVTRAAVMGVVILFAYEIGRISKPQNVLFLAGLAMVMINPKIVLWDVGFQLSFMATLGLLILMPLLVKKLTCITQKFFIRETFSATVSAIAFTLPLSLYYFKGLSLIALMVNVFVVPLVPIAMLFSFISGLLGDMGIVTFLWSVPAWLILSGIFRISEIGASVPFGYIEISAFPMVVSVLLYVLLGTAVRIMKKRPV